MRMTALALALLPVAAAAEYRSLSEAAVMYDAPSLRSKKLYAVSRGVPLEVITNDGQWVKVRDASGELTWVERKVLSDTRTAVVTAPLAEVRQKPEEDAVVLFQAQQGVILEVIEAGGGAWARVRHRDGAAGFVRANQLWGV